MGRRLIFLKSMENINLQLPTPIAVGLALETGWQETIDDTTQEPDGDNYPQIPNPQTYQEYLAIYCSQFIEDYVLKTGRERIVTEFRSHLSAIESQVNNGAFDELLKNGQFDEIKNLVKNSL